jgi:hypothetical protein
MLAKAFLQTIVPVFFGKILAFFDYGGLFYMKHDDLSSKFVILSLATETSETLRGFLKALYMLP